MSLRTGALVSGCGPLGRGSAAGPSSRQGTGRRDVRRRSRCRRAVRRRSRCRRAFVSWICLSAGDSAPRRPRPPIARIIGSFAGIDALRRVEPRMKKGTEAKGHGHEARGVRHLGHLPSVCALPPAQEDRAALASVGAALRFRAARAGARQGVPRLPDRMVLRRARRRDDRNAHAQAALARRYGNDLPGRRLCAGRFHP